MAKFIKSNNSNLYLIIMTILWLLQALSHITKFYILASSVERLANREFEIQQWYSIFFLLSACFILEYFLKGFAPFLNIHFVEKKFYDLFIAIGERITNVKYQVLLKMDHGDILSRIITDVENARRFYLDVLPYFILTLILGIVGFVACLLISWKFLLTLFLTIPIVIVLSIISGRTIRGPLSRLNEVVGSQNAFAIDIIKKLPTVKIFSLENTFREQFQAYSTTIEKEEIDIAKKKSNFSIFRALNIIFPTITMMGVGAFLVWSNEITIGNFTFMIIMSSKIANLAGSIQWFNYQWQEYKSSINRVAMLFEIEQDTPVSDITDKSSKENIFNGSNAAVSINNLNYSYSGENIEDIEHYVFRELNLKIKKGQKVGIVGQSGAGKTTLLMILCALFHDVEGSVEVMGVSNSEENAHFIQDNIALVPQKSLLYPVSILENIRCGRLDASFEEVVAVAKKANIHEYITQLPQGYETIISERNNNLSDGEKQRITLARALIKDAEILILDEPTAALDAQSESLIKDALFHQNIDKTIIMISHRLDMMESMDCVYTLKDGSFVEQGTHSELIALQGEYHTLYQLNQMAT